MAAGFVECDARLRAQVSATEEKAHEPASVGYCFL
jgi:hypothetical protein